MIISKKTNFSKNKDLKIQKHLSLIYMEHFPRRYCSFFLFLFLFIIFTKCFPYFIQYFFLNLKYFNRVFHVIILIQSSFQLINYLIFLFYYLIVLILLKFLNLHPKSIIITYILIIYFNLNLNIFKI
jgi:hypothetical protein